MMIWFGAHLAKAALAIAFRNNNITSRQFSSACAWDYKWRAAVEPEPEGSSRLRVIAFQPGFPRWIGPAGPKGAETLAKLPFPSFTRRVSEDSGTNPA